MRNESGCGSRPKPRSDRCRPYRRPASRRSPVPRSRALWPVPPPVSVSRLAAIRQGPPSPLTWSHVRPCRVHGRCGLWPRRRDVGAGCDPAGAAHTAPRPAVRPCRVHGRKWPVAPPVGVAAIPAGAARWQCDHGDENSRSNVQNVVTNSWVGLASSRGHADSCFAMDTAERGDK